MIALTLTNWIVRGLVVFAGSAVLTLPGDPNALPTDKAGPAFASEMSTRSKLGYGSYRSRFTFATCTPDEEVVTGFFTYFNDGKDRDLDGLTDNSEIDIEQLCSKPWLIYLTAWTEYDTRSGKFKKWSHAIDFSTGRYYDSPSDHEYGLVYSGTNPAFKIPGWPVAGEAVQMGWDWHWGDLRFVATLNGTEVTLWDLTKPALIPHYAGPLNFNVWHSATHWSGGGAANYPANDVHVSVDWVQYWP